MPEQAQYYCITRHTDSVLYNRASHYHYEGFVNVMSVGRAYWLANNRIRKRPCHARCGLAQYVAISRSHECTWSGLCLLQIAVICGTKSRTGNYDFRACARARGFPGSTFSVGHIRFAVCAEARSRDNSLRFLRQFHPDKIWNTLITITYLHR